jgi:hypothetical protein
MCEVRVAHHGTVTEATRWRASCTCLLYEDALQLCSPSPRVAGEVVTHALPSGSKLPFICPWHGNTC